MGCEHEAGGIPERPGIDGKVATRLTQSQLGYLGTLRKYFEVLRIFRELT